MVHGPHFTTPINFVLRSGLLCWSWTIFWQESIARGTHLDHLTTSGVPVLQILFFLNPDKVWGHVIGFNFSEHWFSLYQALIPRCFLQCFHSQFDEDFPGKIVGWKDNGTVAFGFLRNLLNLNKLIYFWNFQAAVSIFLGMGSYS